MLHSLLERGTTTWEGPEGQESTIDFILVSDELAATMIHCRIHETEHGSDYKAIETVFDIDLPKQVVEQRLLFKNALWKSIQDRIELALQRLPILEGVQRQTDQLMAVVLEAIYTLIPKAKLSLYTKQW